MTGTDQTDVAVTATWGATCKDCRSARAAFERSGGTAATREHSIKKSRETFDYPDEWASRALERGGSRSDRCPECRKRHSEKIRAFPVAYIDIAAIGEAEGADRENGPSGPLGGLGPLPPLHRSETFPVKLRQFQLGLNDKIMCQLLEMMAEKQVVVLEAGTGTGKSTLAPFRMMNPPSEAVYKPADFGPIIVTEPRVPATTEVAKFVGESMCFGHDPAVCTKHIGPGYPVGYQCDGQKAWDDSCRLIYVTDGTMINWIRNGDLARFSVVVIDEAHERSENIDTILTLLHQNLRRYPGLKVVIASATLDRDFFLEFFADAAAGVDCLTVDAAKAIGYGVPLFPGATIDEDVLSKGKSIDGVKYEGWRTSVDDQDTTNLREVTTRLLKLRAPVLPLADLAGLKGDDAAVRSADQAFRIIESVCDGSIPAGDVIAFLPGEKECLKAKDELQSKIDDRGLPVHVYWLMKATEDGEKQLAMSACRPGEFKVVFASNLAETSLTIAGLRYVVDSGLIKQAKWNSALASSSVPTVTHSRSGVRQRWGRVGRKTYGWVFPLYTLEQFAAMPKDTPAGSTQVNLEQTILKLAAAGADDLESLKLPANFATGRRDPSGSQLAVNFTAELARSVSALKLNGALTADGSLTPLGREIDRSRLSSERTIALMFADRLACMPEVALAMVALDGGALAGRNGLLRSDWDWPAAWNVHARRCHEALALGCRDELDLVLRIFTDWEASASPEQWADQWWIDHQRLVVYRDEAFKLVEALAPGMSKRAERPIDLRLTDRARAVLSRALRSLQYQKAPDGWYSENPATPREAVAIPSHPLIAPSDRVIAFRRELPRSRWGLPVDQRPLIQGLVEVVAWASDSELEPFQLMLRARQECRGPDDELSLPYDPCRVLRSAWPVGAIMRSEDANTLTVGASTEQINSGFAFPGLPGDQIEPGQAASPKPMKSRVRTVYSSSSSGFDEASGDFRVNVPNVAGVSRPPEETVNESRDIRGLEVAETGGPDVGTSYANAWKSAEETLGESFIDACGSLQTRIGSPQDQKVIIRGYSVRDGIAGLVCEPCTVAEASGGDPSIYPGWPDGKELRLVAGELVSDHFGFYRVLRTCDEDGRLDGSATVYFDGPMLDEWAAGAAHTILENSLWEAVVIPGGRKTDLQTVTLIPTIFQRAASSLGLIGPDGTIRGNVTGHGVIAGPQVSTSGPEPCIPVHLDLPDAPGFVARVLVTRSDAGPLADSLPIGTPVSVELGPKLKARRSGKWPDEVVEHLVSANPGLFKKETNSQHLKLAAKVPLSAEDRDRLLGDRELNPDLVRQVWQLWTTSYHIGAFSLQLNGSGTLDAAFATIVHESTLRSLLDTRHGVRIEFDGEPGHAHVYGSDPEKITAAMADLNTLSTNIAAHYQFPGNKTHDSLIQEFVSEIEDHPGVVAIRLDIRRHSLYLIATDELVTGRIEEGLREITDSVSGVLEFPDDESLKRSQHLTRGVRAVLASTGCVAARLTSASKRQWTIEARSPDALDALLSLVRVECAAPAIGLRSVHASALQVTRSAGTFTAEVLPPTIAVTASDTESRAVPNIPLSPMKPELAAVRAASATLTGSTASEVLDGLAIARYDIGQIHGEYHVDLLSEDDLRYLWPRLDQGAAVIIDVSSLPASSRPRALAFALGTAQATLGGAMDFLSSTTARLSWSGSRPRRPSRGSPSGQATFVPTTFADVLGGLSRSLRFGRVVSIDLESLSEVDTELLHYYLAGISTVLRLRLRREGQRGVVVGPP